MSQKSFSLQARGHKPQAISQKTWACYVEKILNNCQLQAKATRSIKYKEKNKVGGKDNWFTPQVWQSRICIKKEN